MTVVATPLYAGLLALLFIYLTMQVVRARTAHGVSVGDGGEKSVVKAMRVHSNCAEYVPIGILLLGLAELQGMPVWLVHIVGVVFTAGRVLHAYGFGSTPQVVPARVWGMYLTVGSILLLALANIGHAIL
ncbi:MAG: MAPEG family protein [Rhodobacter sp.]|nr:MAPEG family protein [Rhodobacter sp.]